MAEVIEFPRYRQVAAEDEIAVRQLSSAYDRGGNRFLAVLSGLKMASTICRRLGGDGAA
ncbi:MAG: hypothetical protein RLW87_07280 [Alphaproteobacteria bacterium]